MTHELELTGTPEEIANELVIDCIKLPAYTPNPEAFRKIAEWMWVNPSKSYADYRAEEQIENA